MTEDVTSVQATLVKLEEGFWKAAGSNGDYYERNFADDGVMILPFKGGVLSKAQITETVKNAEPWESFEISNPRLLKVSERDIALIYEATGKRNGQEDYAALITSLYHYNENYQLMIHQQTPLN